MQKTAYSKTLFSVLLSVGLLFLAQIAEAQVRALPQVNSTIGYQTFTLGQFAEDNASWAISWDSKTTGHYYYKTRIMTRTEKAGFAIPDDAINVDIRADVVGGSTPGVYLQNGIGDVRYACLYGNFAAARIFLTKTACF